MWVRDSREGSCYFLPHGGIDFLGFVFVMIIEWWARDGKGILTYLLTGRYELTSD